MSHLLGCHNSQHPLNDASELWWWDIIERGERKEKVQLTILHINKKLTK
jgi:hypothetical protein